MMTPILSFEEMFSRLKTAGTKVRVAVVDGIDASTVEALHRAVACGFAAVVFVGKRPDLAGFPAFHTAASLVSYEAPQEGKTAAETAVALIRAGKADFLMKGLLHTSELLRAVLHKEHGLLPAGEVLTHIAVAQTEKYHKLLFFTDSAVIPVPTDEQREQQLVYAIDVAQAFGIVEPRIAMLHFSEEVSEKFPLTLHYRKIVAAQQRGEYGAALIDGPLDLRTAVDPVALAVKGIASPIEGKADVLLFPTLEAGNGFYKTLSYFGGATIAGTLCGTTCPVVVNSRGDDSDSKFYSLALAATVVAAKKKSLS